MLSWENGTNQGSRSKQPFKSPPLVQFVFENIQCWSCNNTAIRPEHKIPALNVQNKISFVESPLADLQYCPKVTDGPCSCFQWSIAGLGQELFYSKVGAPNESSIYCCLQWFQQKNEQKNRITRVELQYGSYTSFELCLSLWTRKDILGLSSPELPFPAKTVFIGAYIHTQV